MPGKQLNILVVDGDVSANGTLLQSVQRASDRRGTVRSCSDLAGALTEMRSSQAQIIFLGENLPDGTNLDIARAFSKQFPRSACIIVSSSRDEKFLIDALRAGAKDFLTKPISQDAVDEAVTRCSDRWNSQRDRSFDEATLHGSKLELELPTSAAALLPAVDAVVELTRGFLSDHDIKGLEVALNEALRNAYEHGNLEMTFEEKSAFCDAGTFEEELNRRSIGAVAAGKKILLAAEIRSDCLRCTVTDEGKGFDPQSIPDPSADSGVAPSANGRGVALMRRYFDRVEYLKQGSQVILEKKLR